MQILHKSLWDQPRPRLLHCEYDEVCINHARIRQLGETIEVMKRVAKSLDVDRPIFTEQGRHLQNITAIP